MRNQKTTTSLSRNWILALVIGVVVLIAAAYAVYAQSHQAKTTVTPSPTVNSSPATSEDNKAIDDRKNQPLVTPTPTGSPAANASNMAVKITGASVASGNVHVGNLVSNATAGSCTLTAAQGGQNVQQLATSSVHLDVNDYDCGAYNVPTSKFPGSGAWQLSLTVTNGSDKVTDTYDVTIP